MVKETQMTLWIVQLVEIYTMIKESRGYRCNPDMINMVEFTKRYDWLQINHHEANCTCMMVVQ